MDTKTRLPHFWVGGETHGGTKPLSLQRSALLTRWGNAWIQDAQRNNTPSSIADAMAIRIRSKVFARRFKRAQILLLADDGHPDGTIAQMLYVGESTVHQTRQKFVDGGVEFALSEAPHPGGKRKLDGKAEAFLVAIAYSEPPKGKAEWTMQMLTDRLVEVNLVDQISDETVHRRLKKTTSSSG